MPFPIILTILDLEGRVLHKGAWVATLLGTLLGVQDKGVKLFFILNNFFQMGPCRSAIQELKKNFPNVGQDKTALLEVAIFVRDKQWEQAIAFLQVRMNLTNGFILRFHQ